jgi:hypothetical protein
VGKPLARAPSHAPHRLRRSNVRIVSSAKEDRTVDPAVLTSVPSRSFRAGTVATRRRRGCEPARRGRCDEFRPAHLPPVRQRPNLRAARGQRDAKLSARTAAQAARAEEALVPAGDAARVRAGRASHAPRPGYRPPRPNASVPSAAGERRSRRARYVRASRELLRGTRQVRERRAKVGSARTCFASVPCAFASRVLA